ncbi:MAG: S8 family serine peptidase [Bdellovibrionales bacterium]|nr:S8 family serine peptidase [Bdellovibrionales bacterium]
MSLPHILLLFLALNATFETAAAKAKPKKKETPVAEFWVRKLPPPNIEKLLPTLVPKLADAILSTTRALCDVSGKVASTPFTEALQKANGPHVTKENTVIKDFSSEVRGEIYMASLENLPNLKVSSSFVGGAWTSSLIEFRRGLPEQLFNRYEIIRVTVDDDCVAEDAILFNYDSDRYLRDVRFVDPDMDVTRPVYEARKSLADVYADPRNLPSGKTLANIFGIAARTDRTLVAIYDSGIDYNHPTLAYKIPQPPVPMTAAIEQRLSSIRSELAQINREKESLTFTLGTASKKAELGARANVLRSEAQSYTFGWAFDRDDHLPFDFVFEPMNPHRQFADHGTHVAGIVSRDSDDIALLPLRYAITGDRDHHAAIKYAHSKGARIVNISLGNASPYVFENFERTLDEFKDMLFIVAAGNDGVDLGTKKVWPAEFSRPNLIAVGATHLSGVFARGSNYSPTKVDLAAIGVEVKSLAPIAMGGVATYSGTSQAAPQVTRVAAKIKFINPDLTPVQIREILCLTADKSPELATKVRCGQLNEVAAVRFASEKNSR